MRATEVSDGALTEIGEAEPKVSITETTVTLSDFSSSDYTWAITRFQFTLAGPPSAGVSEGAITIGFASDDPGVGAECYSSPDVVDCFYYFEDAKMFSLLDPISASYFGADGPEMELMFGTDGVSLFYALNSTEVREGMAPLPTDLLQVTELYVGFTHDGAGSTYLLDIAPLIAAINVDV